MTNLELELLHYGYVRDPNGAGNRWYAGSPGILELNADVRINDDGHIDAYPKWYEQHLTLARYTFYTIDAFVKYLKRYGHPSDPGQQEPEWID